MSWANFTFSLLIFSNNKQKDLWNDQEALAASMAIKTQKSYTFSLMHDFPSLFSADFANALSKALGIPKWRFFNIRTQEAEVDKCQIVKFGIIGTGLSSSLCLLTVFTEKSPLAYRQEMVFT